ncbi:MULTISPECIES: minor capsid protein [Cyanophyceae]|uniref:minor capsid protein n=1 Tax=Cyanophyceae TaxID=3028117 RepID=UPI00168777CC|nr:MULTISPECIES: minor capsid protein [Cyanophyceae]MBD1918859.1 minor capsid protein [Phormidium sp. FACHB-77]MBD2033298.1 minor capsid protein [Phormidium sp. FACHB-322]MBD2053769.1 minor capsid protein [Leptolyngbya sp. FACHB-60]
MATRSFSDIERIVARYDSATTELDAAVTDRIADSLDASYRNLERELRSLYPRWQSDGSLYAVQRRLLLMEQLGETLAIVRPEMQGEYEALMTEALQISHESGAKMADELVRARDPGYPLQEFTTVPIEAAIAQARDGVQRLYRYNDNFKTAVSGVVEQGLLQGWGAEKVARMLRGNEQMQGQFGLAQLKSKAETIARTEIMSSFDTATQQRYAENGITHIQWLATPSERLCSYCLARHGNVYKLGEVTAPSHPRCRCITCSWLPKWAERGWTDDAAIAADKTTRLEEMAKLGTKPNNGPTYWEKRAGLTEAPQAVWKPGDAPPVAPKPAAKVVAKPLPSTPSPSPTNPAIISRADTAAKVNQALVDKFGQDTVSKAQSNAQKILDKSDIYIRVPDAQVLGQIISDGRFKASGELAAGRLAPEGVTLPKGKDPFARALRDSDDDITDEAYYILDYQNRRDSQESFMFGAAIADNGYAQRPIYGYMADTADIDNAAHTGAAGYGAVAVRLKAEAKDRATVAGQDSFAGGLPVPAKDYSAAGAIRGAAIGEERVVDDPDTGAALQGMARAKNVAELNRATVGAYTEAQVHGQVQASDIAGLTFTKGTRPTPEIQQWAQENNVEITIIK